MTCKLFRKHLIPVFCAGVIFLSACTDNNYDFDQVDLTVGIGNGEILLPTSSTDTIGLSNILELGDDDCIVERANGDYVFEQTGNDVEPSHPFIDKIRIVQRSMESQDISMSLTGGAAQRADRVPVQASGIMQTFVYEGDKPSEVLELSDVDMSGSYSFSLNFNDDLRQCISSFDKIVITFPDFMLPGNATSNAPYTTEGTAYVFENVPTSAPLQLTSAIDHMRFGIEENELGYLRIEGDKVLMHGRVKVEFYGHTASDSPAQSVVTMTSDMAMSDLVIDGATGRFAPEVKLDNLGDITISGVPDFLTDSRVVVDLYNPQVAITVSNDMNFPVIFDGTLTSYKDGRTLASVDVTGIRFNPAGTTTVCLCRNAAATTGSFDSKIEVAALSELIRTIPDNIKFEGTARTDESVMSAIRLGHNYNVSPAYNIEAPVMFEKDAVIVYNDSIDGWAEDIEDFDLKEDTYITMSTTVENTLPAYLTLTATPIDTEGNAIPSGEISIDMPSTVLASTANGEKATTDISMKIMQHKHGALKKLDGIALSVEGKAAGPEGTPHATGIVLNAKKHYLIAKDIKIKLVGTIVSDLN